MTAVNPAPATAFARAEPSGRTAPELLAGARALTGLLGAQAAANEARGALGAETLNALRDHGLMGMWIPRELGGSEVWPLDSLEIIEALAYADASTGWVFMATQLCMGTAAAYLPRPTATSLFAGAQPVIAGQGAAIGRADVVQGGYRLSGKWRYGSGVLHAQYLHTGAVVFEDGMQRFTPGTSIPETRIFIVPVQQARLLANWDVLGLRATGSIDYEIAGAFVPEELTHLHLETVPRQGGDLYRIGLMCLSAIGHCGFTLGVGRRVLDELIALARERPSRSSLIVEKGGGEAFQERFGAAEASLRAARAFVIEAQRDIEATARAGRDVSTRQITLARLALNHVTAAVADICTFAYRYGGGTALRAGALQRCFRDMHAAAQHASTSPAMLRECAKDLLGAAPGHVWTLRSLADPQRRPS